jgi:hypothetical protein
MTNDQSPMTNDDGAERPIQWHPAIRIRHWDLVIGIWSLPGSFANAFANDPS